MKDTDRLEQAFDSLDADINKLLQRYRKLKEDRARLLKACQGILDEHGTRVQPSNEAIERCRIAVYRSEGGE